MSLFHTSKWLRRIVVSFACSLDLTHPELGQTLVAWYRRFSYRLLVSFPLV